MWPSSFRSTFHESAARRIDGELLKRFPGSGNFPGKFDKDTAEKNWRGEKVPGRIHVYFPDSGTRPDPDLTDAEKDLDVGTPRKARSPCQ